MSGLARRPGALAAALWVGALVIAGFTLRNHLEPFDEGLLLQAAQRVADGQWPYADFSWAYGPGHPLAVALGFEAFGRSVLIWRLLWAVSCASIAVLVWWFVRRGAGDRWALAAWVAAATTVAQPMLANPVIPALALALGALALAVARRPAAAGVLVALAAFWRPDFGLLALAAALLAGGGVRAALTAVGTGIVLYAPFAVAAGVDTLWRALVTTSLRGGDAWRLPFPWLYDGPLRLWPPVDFAQDAKDVLGYQLPLIGAAGLVASLGLLAVSRSRRRDGVALGAAALGVGSLAYLLSRADEFHAQPLLLCVCVLAPLAGARRRPAAAAIPLAVLAVVAAAGLANRLSAAGGPEDLVAVHLPGVPGIRVPPTEARALPPLVATVQRLVPPGQPIYVAPRRSDLVTSTAPIVHFLVDRPNVLHRDALLQAEPDEQARIVVALRAARPRAVVRWISPASSHPEPNARGRPSGSTALDDYLGQSYRETARFGDYVVLVPR